MNDNDIRNAFGKPPEQFRQSVADTLDRLEDRNMKKYTGKIIIAAIAVLIALVGIAAAAGGTYLFEIFGRNGDEEGLVNISSEPVAVNADLTATVDQAYYDGSEFFYEITLTLTDPTAYALIDNSAIGRSYAPPEDIVHIHIEPCLWDRFELVQEFGEEYHNGYGNEEAQLEDMGDGVYKLYGRSFVYFDADLTLPDELDVDVNLHMTYAPQHENFHQDQEPIDAEIPFHITKTASADEYMLTPVNVPDGWNITEATLSMTAVGGNVSIKYNLGGPIVEDPIYDMDDPEFEAQFAIVEENSHIFYLQDPANPAEHIATGGASIEFYEFFDVKMSIPAMDPVPESLIFDVTYYDVHADGTFEELPLTAIEFTVTPVE